VFLSSCAGFSGGKYDCCKTFGLVITTELHEDGTKKSGIQSINHGVQDEVVITLLRNLLRNAEEDYYAGFAGKTN
jgi:hypothetical protein